jgi:hypothetical protein
VMNTFVNGHMVYNWDVNEQKHNFPESIPGMRLHFNR